MTPTAEQLDHLIGHTANRALTPDEHAALRDGIRALRAVLAGSLEATLSATLGRPSLGTYHQQVVKQLAAAEDELGQWRRQGRRAERYRAAWLSARRRAASWNALYRAIAADRDQRLGSGPWITLRGHQAALRRVHARRSEADIARFAAEARIAAAHRFADEMATYCSPHGVAALYAERLRAALDGAQP